MGAGNYLPHVECYEMVYVDTPSIVEDENANKENFQQEDYEFWYLDLKATILEILPPSFYKPTQREWVDRNTISIARNQLIDVCLADNGWSTAVVIRARENEDWMETHSPLAPLHVQLLAKRLFNRLNEMYDLSIRCGPWTSGKFLPI